MEYKALLLNFAGPEKTFRHVSMEAVLFPKENNLTDEDLRRIFSGKLVFIGSTSEVDKDISPTPTSTGFPGVEIHATLAQMLLSGKFLMLAPLNTARLVLLLFVGLTAALVFWLRPLKALVPVLTLSVACLYGVVFLLDRWLLVMPVAQTLMAMALAFVLSTAYLQFSVERHARHIRERFQRFVAPVVLDTMVFASEEALTRPRRLEASVLFSDLQGFTTISERRLPEEVAALLNEYFEAMTSVLDRYHGTIKWLPSRVGTPLANGDRVRTGKRSYAEVTFADKSIVKLNEKSELTVASTADLKQEMELHRGSLWARFVKGAQATVKAKTTVAAVRGTTILIAIQGDGSVLVRVQMGLLEVTNLQTGEQVTVEAGNEITVSPDPTAPLPSPTRAPPPQFGSDPTPTDQPFTEFTVTGEQTLATVGAPDFSFIQVSDPAFVGTNPSVPEIGSAVSPGGGAVPPTGVLELTVRSRQAILETSGIALTGDARPRRIVGVQLRPKGTVGNLFYVVSVLPITDTAGTTRTRWTEGYLAYKDERTGTIRFGRQWFSPSPVTASLTGQLIINDIADAVSWQKTFGRTQVNLAYLYDAQPFTKGQRQGVYLRFSQPIRGGYLGVSGLKMRGATIGYALDFSQPIISNDLEIYGELGQGFSPNPVNPDRLLRGSFYTVGLYFPSLYQRYDTDLFVEYTKAPRGAPANNLFSVRAFYTVLPGLKLVFIGQRRGKGVRDSGNNWTVGLIYTTQFALR